MARGRPVRGAQRPGRRRGQLPLRAVLPDRRRALRPAPARRGRRHRPAAGGTGPRRVGDSRCRTRSPPSARSGTVVITDGLTLHRRGPDVGSAGAPIADITIRGDDQGRAVIRITPGTGPWIFQGPAATGQPGARLRLEGLLLSGTDLRAARALRRGVLSCCTLDPGTSGDLRTPPEVWDARVDGRDLSPADHLGRGRRAHRWSSTAASPARSAPAPAASSRPCASTDSVHPGAAHRGTGPALTALRDADGLFAALRDSSPPRTRCPTGSPASCPPPSAAAVSGHADGDPSPAADPQLVVADLAAVIDGAADLDARPGSPAARCAPQHRRRGAGPADRARAGRAQPAAARGGVPARARRRRARADAGTGQTCPAARCSARASCTGWSAASRSWTTSCACSDAQDGCVRFSRLVRRQRPAAPVRVGPDRPRRADPGRAAGSASGATPSCPRRRRQPRSSPRNTGGPPSILTGSHDGSEMGVFCRDGAAVKDRSLLIKLQEYLPVGLSPVLLHLPAADPQGELTRGRPWPPT